MLSDLRLRSSATVEKGKYNGGAPKVLSIVHEMKVLMSCDDPC